MQLQCSDAIWTPAERTPCLLHLVFKLRISAQNKPGKTPVREILRTLGRGGAHSALSSFVALKEDRTDSVCNKASMCIFLPSNYWIFLWTPWITPWPPTATGQNAVKMLNTLSAFSLDFHTEFVGSRLQMRWVYIDEGPLPDRFVSRCQLPLSRPSFIKSPRLVDAQQMCTGTFRTPFSLTELMKMSSIES